MKMNKISKSHENEKMAKSHENEQNGKKSCKLIKTESHENGQKVMNKYNLKKLLK